MAGPDHEWECVSQLGSGGFGIVHVWRHRDTGQSWALKRCRLGGELGLTTRAREAWVRECDIMLRSVNVTNKSQTSTNCFGFLEFTRYDTLLCILYLVKFYFS